MKVSIETRLMSLTRVLFVTGIVSVGWIFVGFPEDLISMTCCIGASIILVFAWGSYLLEKSWAK